MSEFWTSLVENVFVQPLHQLGETLVASGAEILQALVVLILGHLIAAALRRVTTHGLRAFGVDVIYRRLNHNRDAAQEPVVRGPSDLGGFVVYWTIMLSAALYALQVLGLNEAQILLQRLLDYLPKIFVSIGLVTIGMYAADLIGRIVTTTAASAQLPAPRWWGIGVQYATVGFTAVAVFDYLEIATNSVVLVLGLVTSVVPAAAIIAFGLGGRRPAAELIQGRTLRSHISAGDGISFQHEGRKVEGVVEDLSPTCARVRTGEAVLLVPYSVLGGQVTAVRPADETGELRAE